MREYEIQPYHHGDLKRALIDTAMQMLEEQQNWQFTLREVARRTGVSHAAPYNHFADKDALLAEVAVIGFERLDASMREITYDGAASVVTAIHGFAFKYFHFAVANPALYRLMFIGTPHSMDAVYGNDRTLSALDYVDKVIRQGQVDEAVRPLDSRGLAVACWAQVHGLAMLAIQGFLKLDGSDAQLVGPSPLETAFLGLSFGIFPTAEPE